MTVDHSAAIYADARLQSIAAARLASIEDTGGPSQAPGYEEIMRHVVERHGMVGALALVVALARDVGVLVGLVAGDDPSELLDQLEMDVLSDSHCGGDPRRRRDL